MTATADCGGLRRCRLLLPAPLLHWFISTRNNPGRFDQVFGNYGLLPRARRCSCCHHAEVDARTDVHGEMGGAAATMRWLRRRRHPNLTVPVAVQHLV